MGGWVRTFDHTVAGTRTLKPLLLLSESMAPRTLEAGPAYHVKLTLPRTTRLSLAGMFSSDFTLELQRAAKLPSTGPGYSLQGPSWRFISGSF